MSVRKLIQEDSAVSFKVFFSVVGLLVTLMTVSTGYFFNESSKLQARVEQTKQDCQEKTLQIDKNFDEHVAALNNQNQVINIKLAEIQSDILWIRRVMSNEIQTSKPQRRTFDK